MIASAGLLLAASIPLGLAALTDWVTIPIAAVGLVLLLTTELDTLWIILGAALISLSASSLGLIGMSRFASFALAARNAWRWPRTPETPSWPIWLGIRSAS